MHHVLLCLSSPAVQSNTNAFVMHFATTSATAKIQAFFPDHNAQTLHVHLLLQLSNRCACRIDAFLYLCIRQLQPALQHISHTTLCHMGQPNLQPDQHLSRSCTGLFESRINLLITVNKRSSQKTHTSANGIGSRRHQYRCRVFSKMILDKLSTTLRLFVTSCRLLELQSSHPPSVSVSSFLE